MAYLEVSSRVRNATKPGEPAVISALILAFIALLCLSLVSVAEHANQAFHIRFDSQNLLFAALSMAAFACCAILFASAKFSFGFVVSFYLLAVAAGYLWLSYFTPLEYNHAVVRMSVVASFAALAFPSLFVTRPMLNRDLITRQQMNWLMYGLLFSAALTGAYAYLFGFRVVGIAEAQMIRGGFDHPAWLRYAIPISTTTILPFIYAWFVTQKRYALAALPLLLLLLLYPVTLNKMTLFSPFWLVTLTVLLRFVAVKPAVVFSLMVPMTIGLAMRIGLPDYSREIFGIINLRMIAVPATGIDHYAHFFSTREFTGFCQIRIIGELLHCSMPDQLGVLMAGAYSLGNFNASLLATEGIASVGPYLAPFVALLCGAVIAVGNMASARLDQTFVLLSASIMVQALMNIPLSTVMMTHGGLLMFALWLITPGQAGKQKV